MTAKNIIGYYASFSDSEDDVVSNMDGSIIVFGSVQAFKEYLTTVEGEQVTDITFNSIDYKQLFLDMDTNYVFALDEIAFNNFREVANEKGRKIPKKDFTEKHSTTKNFATLKKNIILH